MRRKISNEGQSTVEFALTLTLLISFLMIFVQVSLVFAYGNFAHYATFMAARALLSASDSVSDQEARAKEVVIRLLKKSEGQPSVDRWPGVAQAQGGGDVRGASIGNDPHFQDGEFSLSWMQGVRYVFRSRLYLAPLGGGSSSNSVTLTSESWLGRDPSFSECVGRVGRGYFDNGC